MFGTSMMVHLTRSLALSWLSSRVLSPFREVFAVPICSHHFRDVIEYD